MQLVGIAHQGPCFGPDLGDHHGIKPTQVTQGIRSERAAVATNAAGDEPAAPAEQEACEPAS